MYPTMIKHIFSGYRGEEAAHKLVSIQGTFGDIRGNVFYNEPSVSQQASWPDSGYNAFLGTSFAIA